MFHGNLLLKIGFVSFVGVGLLFSGGRSEAIGYEMFIQPEVVQQSRPFPVDPSLDNAPVLDLPTGIVLALFLEGGRLRGWSIRAVDTLEQPDPSSVEFGNSHLVAIDDGRKVFVTSIPGLAETSQLDEGESVVVEVPLAISRSVDRLQVKLPGSRKLLEIDIRNRVEKICANQMADEWCSNSLGPGESE